MQKVLARLEHSKAHRTGKERRKKRGDGHGASEPKMGATSIESDFAPSSRMAKGEVGEVASELDQTHKPTTNILLLSYLNFPPSCHKTTQEKSR